MRELHCNLQSSRKNEVYDILTDILLHCLIDRIVLTRVRINTKVEVSFLPSGRSGNMLYGMF